MKATPATSATLPKVLTVAGSDGSGGAGVQADVVTLSALGTAPLSVVTAITVQRADGVLGWTPVDRATVRAQLDAAGEERPAAVKSGMLGELAAAEELADFLDRHRDTPYVCDPLVRSGTGVALLADGARELLRGGLVPRATVVTPNFEELAMLAGVTTPDSDDACVAAARRLLAVGAGAVLVTGGHRRLRGVDLLVTGGGVERFGADPVPCARVHGAGCVLSSAIAASLAAGAALSDAVRAARRYVGDAIAAGSDRRGVRFPAPRWREPLEARR